MKYKVEVTLEEDINIACIYEQGASWYMEYHDEYYPEVADIYLVIMAYLHEI